MRHIPPSVDGLLVNFSQEIGGLSYVPGYSIAGSWDRTEPGDVVGIRRSFLEPGGCPRPGGPGGRFEPGGCSGPGGCFGPGGRLRTRRFLQTLRSYLGPRGRIRTRRSFKNPEVPSDLEDPEVILNPGYDKNLEVYLFQTLRSFQDPETAWGPEGTILCLPRQDCSWYLFGFRILPLGSWPLSSSYVVFYFCGKSLTGLEGAGVGVMTQVPGFAAFHVWRRRVLTGPWMDAGVGARASLNRNLEAGVLPEAWMIFPNQFASYFSISSSNSGNNLCTQVNRSCSFSAGFPWTGHRSSNPSFPGGSWPEVVLSGWASTPACRWQVLWAWREQDVALKSPFLGLAGEDHLYQLKSAVGDLLPRSEVGILDLGFALQEIQDPGLACRWMARLVGLAGEDHLYQLKSAVGDLLPRSEVGILNLGFALQ
ncbi:hypothetical protein F2Q68_00004569 [Brassica cretica]|uniref:Uncharacterized protein n=1 Tax=Brassica cretica TaxID=69181 RepID=A0A8S9JLY4_BRACR|nr:hypothetical protein F2Q68_00004569 [Brassica cretica]